MKTFSQFVTEAKEIHDQEGLGSGTGTTHRGGSKIGAERKLTAPERRRTKAVGGGKTAPAKEYKQRKDAGEQRPAGRSTESEQQPTRERGSARLSAREQQRKAAKERRAAKSSGSNKKDLEKAATKLLTKKKDTTSSKYKPQKASGYTAHERRKLQRSGDRLLRDISKGKEKPASHYDPKK